MMTNPFNACGVLGLYWQNFSGILDMERCCCRLFDNCIAIAANDVIV